MTLVNYFIWVAGQVVAMLLPVAVIVSHLPFLSVLLTLLFVLAIIIQSFSLCWRRLHDLSLPGWWVFALPFVAVAGDLLMEWQGRRIFQADIWTRFLEHAGAFGLLVLGLLFSAIYIFSGIWVVAVIGVFPGRRGENRYGPLPGV